MTTTILTQTAGFTCTQHEDGFLIFEIHDARRVTVDAFFDAFRKYDEEAYKSGQSRRTLIDMSAAGWWPTPYFISRMMQASKETSPDLIESAAVVIGMNKLAFRMVENMLGKLTGKTQQNTRLFLLEEDAVQWLRDRP